VYSYSEGNPINKRDPNGRDADYTGAIAVPIFEFLSLGPTGGLVVDPTTDDPMVYLGVTATPKPGVSGGVYYAPTPSEGWSVSGSIPPAGQISVSREKGKLTTSGEVGYSYPPGVGVSLVYTMSLSKFLYDIGGPLQYSSTPMLTGNSFNSFSSGINQYASCYAGLLSNSISSRVNSASSINTVINSPGSGGSGGRSSGSASGGGSSQPNANSLWVTPSGAVVTWSGSLVVGPVSSK